MQKLDEGGWMDFTDNFLFCISNHLIHIKRLFLYLKQGKNIHRHFFKF